MVTDAQLEAFDESHGFMPWLEFLALRVIYQCDHRGATVDEAYRRAFPKSDFDHAAVDSFRVAIFHLRDRGEVMNSGAKRVSPDTGRKQTVWVIGDDREVVAQDRRRKLTKFPTRWLIDELRDRGVEVRRKRWRLKHE